MTDSLHTDHTPLPTPSELDNRFYNKRAAAKGGWRFIAQEYSKSIALTGLIVCALQFISVLYIWNNVPISISWLWLAAMMGSGILSTWVLTGLRYLKPLGWLVTGMIAIIAIAIYVSAMYFVVNKLDGSLTQFVIDHLILDFTSAGVA
jgi:hypothetical protein